MANTYSMTSTYNGHSGGQFAPTAFGGTHSGNSQQQNQHQHQHQHQHQPQHQHQHPHPHHPAGPPFPPLPHHLHNPNHHQNSSMGPVNGLAAAAATAANQQGFDANGFNAAALPAIPPTVLAQPGQFPTLNFEELKNYASAHGHALPLPPLPPPPALMNQFANSPLPSNLFPLPLPPPPPAFSNSPYSHPSLPTTPVPSGHIPPVSLAASNHPPSDQTPNSIPGLGDADKTPPDTNKGDMESVKKHDLVRAAMKEMNQAGISYKNLLDEGIQPPVLDRLFKELGLSPDPKSTSARPAAIVAESTSTSRQATITPQLDPNLERKDRIAQLLAARKGQVISPKPAPAANSSTTASEQPVSSATTKTAATTKPTANVGVPMSSSTSSAHTTSASSSTITGQRIPPSASTPAQPQPSHGTKPSEHVTARDLPPTETATKDFASIPTPVRELAKDTNFSIPGLFMTDSDASEQAFQSSINVLKRNARSIDSLVSQPNAKRQASQSISPTIPKPTPDQRSIDQQQSSRLLVPESAPSPGPRVNDQSNIDARIPGLEPVEKSTGESRAKINQNRLKDRMAALKADLMRKNQRKKDLQDGMPVLNAEVQNTRNHLSEKHRRLGAVKNDIASAQTQLDTWRLEEADLIADIEKLERQLADAENGQQRFSNELNQLNDQIVAGERASHPTTTSAVPSPSQEKPLWVQAEATAPPLDPAATDSAPPPTDPIGDVMVTTSVRAPQVADHLDQQLNDVSSMSHAHAQPAETSVSSPEDGLVDDSDNDDDRMSIDEASDPGSDGSASMSDSGSEYEPAVPDLETSPRVDHAHAHAHTHDDNDMEEGEEYEPSDMPPPMVTMGDNDDYEPTEDTPNIDVADFSEQPTPAYTSDVDNNPPSVPLSPTTPQILTATTSSPQASSIDDSLDPAVANTHAIRTDVDVRVHPDTDVTHSAPTFDVPSDSVAVLEPSEPLSSSLSTSTSTTTPRRFVPYSSPLANLKSFRFHPQFNETVKTGYRSLTYSNRIDPKQPLCQTELQGQICDDPTCEDQHFSSMVLPDDKILVQMSSANDIADKARRDQYLLGLKKVIADLRGQGVKEFSDVANALSKYRREWKASQDDSYF